MLGSAQAHGEACRCCVFVSGVLFFVSCNNTMVDGGRIQRPYPFEPHGGGGDSLRSPKLCAAEHRPVAPLPAPERVDPSPLPPPSGAGARGASRRLLLRRSSPGAAHLDALSASTTSCISRIEATGRASGRGSVSPPGVMLRRARRSQAAGIRVAHAAHIRVSVRGLFLIMGIVWFCSRLWVSGLPHLCFSVSSQSGRPTVEAEVYNIFVHARSAGMVALEAAT